MSGWLPAELAAGARGRGARIFLIDSGVTFAHPHLGFEGRGFAVLRRGETIEVAAGDHRDRVGHGTCCAALIHALAPEAELVAIRVMDDRPTTDVDRVLRAIRLGIEEGATILCTPLGTDGERAALLDLAVAEAEQAGVWVVAPLPSRGVRPGASPGAIGVERLDGVDVAILGAQLVADGNPRPAPGLPSNFRGPSLSSARTAAAIARWVEQVGQQARGPNRVQDFKRSLPVR